MLAACRDPTGCNCKLFNYGLWQMFLSVILVGFIWSVIWGSKIYNKSNAYYGGTTKTAASTTTTTTVNGSPVTTTTTGNNTL